MKLFIILNLLLIILISSANISYCSNQFALNKKERQLSAIKDVPANKISNIEEEKDIFDGVPIYATVEKIEKQKHELVTCPWESSATSNSQCGCYTKWILYRPNCASEALYWCSNSLICTGSSCGTVKLGSFSYCKQFPLFGFLLLEQFKACGSTSDERSSVGYLGDLQGFKYNPQLNLYIGSGLIGSDFKVVTSGSSLGLSVGVTYKKFYIQESPGDAKNLIANTNACGNKSWYIYAKYKLSAGLVVKESSSTFIKGCKCNLINPQSNTNSPSPKPTSSTMTSNPTRLPTQKPALVPTSTISPSNSIPGGRNRGTSIDSPNFLIIQDYIISLNSRYYLQFQVDGNLVVKDNFVGTILFSSHTENINAEKVVIQQDGNMIIFRQNEQLWRTDTSGQGIVTLTITNDGVAMLLKKSNGQLVWKSDCTQKSCRNSCIDGDDDCCPASGFCDGKKCFNGKCYPWDSVICTSGGYCNGADFSKCCEYPSGEICVSEGRYCCPNHPHSCAIGEKCCGSGCIKQSEECCGDDGSYCSNPSTRCCLRNAIVLQPLYYCRDKAITCEEMCGTSLIEKELLKFDFPEVKIPFCKRTSKFRVGYRAYIKTWCSMNQNQINTLLIRLTSIIEGCISRTTASKNLMISFNCFINTNTGCESITKDNLDLASIESWDCIKNDITASDVARFVFGCVLSEFKASFKLFIDTESVDWMGDKC